MKIMTRCFPTDRLATEVYAAIGRAFIEAYIGATRDMDQPISLVSVKAHQRNHDLQFTLTFKPLLLTTRQVMRVPNG